MTAPQNAFELDDVTFSDTTETNLTSPAISISPIPVNAQGRRENPTNHQHSALSASENHPHAEPAYAANLHRFSDHPSGFLHYALDPPSVTILDTDAVRALATGPNPDSHATSNAGLALASFGNQPWEEASTGPPYLAFAPQPVYEPAGQLLHEQAQTFEQFDNPAQIWFDSEALAKSSLQSPPDLPKAGSAESPNPKHVNVFVQPKVPRSVLKRKADSLESPAAEGQGSKKFQAPGHNSGKPRTVSFERMSGLGPTSPDEGSTSSDLLTAQHRGDGTAGSRRTRQSTASTPRAGSNVQNPQQATRSNRGARAPSGHPPSILQPERVFPIQIGSELFRLSGASISSDAPSYFTQFFEQQIRENEESGNIRTLYIDRDPETFRDVARHLQGYYVKPRDGSHFVKLFADAQFYSLPRLIDQLFESEIFIQIGERNFMIPKDIFSEPGNSPNFFSLGFAVFFSTPGEVFPGLDRRGLLRPPSITPPYVPGRSADIFAELLHLLRGYPLQVRNESHRAELLRDCRYFHLRGLEQKVIAHEITYNLERQKQEISLRLEDVKPSGVSFNPNDSSDGTNPTGGWVYYARPFVDEISFEMVVEIGGECTVLDLNDMRVDFHNLTKARVSSLFQVVANKMNLPINAPLGLMMLSGSSGSRSASPGHTPLSEDRVKVRFEPATDIVLNGERLEIDWNSPRGQHLSQGPSLGLSESESDSDIMSEDTSSSKAQAKRPQRQQQQPQRTPSTQSGRSSLAVPPPLQTTRLSGSEPSAKKRKRQGSRDKLGEWVIRTGQWRLRVQPNPQDTIRGGFEIVFLGVKIDAYSSERARNARRSFLS